MGFILRVEVIAESLAFCVEYAGAIIGLVILMQTRNMLTRHKRPQSVRCCGCENRAEHEKRGTGKMNRRQAVMFPFKTSKGFQ